MRSRWCAPFGMSTVTTDGEMLMLTPPAYLCVCMYVYVYVCMYIYMYIYIERDVCVCDVCAPLRGDRVDLRT